MAEEEIRQMCETERTVGSIRIAEFESHDALKEWVSKKASAFVRIVPLGQRSDQADQSCQS